MSNKSSINWFKLNRNLHRDIGYFCVGLVIIFAVSGIAVNHKDDWNPNYQVSHQQINVSDETWQLDNDELLIEQIISHADVSEPVKASYWVSPQEFKVFLKNGNNLSLKLNKDIISYEAIEPRHVFQAFNRLHLNETNASWVIFSDIFAGLLLFLAISGLFMLKGKNSPWGSRSVLVISGMLLPAAYVFL